MNFNIYLDDSTGQQLLNVAEEAGETKNALIRKAVSEWLARQGKPQWPEVILAFQGINDATRFEDARQDLHSPSLDPLA